MAMKSHRSLHCRSDKLHIVHFAEDHPISQLPTTCYWKYVQSAAALMFDMPPNRTINLTSRQEDCHDGK